ncbi:Helix-turn-helix domain protein [anaerobic digester metagenome]
MAKNITLQEISVKLALTVEEAAMISNIGENKLRDLIHVGKLDHFKLGNRFQIPLKSLERFIEESGKRRDQI